MLSWAMNCLAAGAALFAVAGLGQAVAGTVAVWRFLARPDVLPADSFPAVTVLKPLCGDEPLLEKALASLCVQDYPHYQIVFGVQDEADLALAVVARLQSRFPETDIAVVVDSTPHGVNRKIANLINMFPAARHDVLVIADSDVHVAPDYLSRLVDTLDIPATGLVTTLYTGLPANRSLAASLGATGITHGFLPGALMARDLGRQDCLGATMALRRATLGQIGGLHALADHLADDHVLGKRVQALGLAVRLAPTIAATTVPEASVADLFHHELRWSRTVLSLVPVAFALSSIQFPLFWAVLAFALSGGSKWAALLFLAAWGVRAATSRTVDRLLGLAKSGLASAAPIWLLPLRDLMSVVGILASYASDRVKWRGQTLSTGRGALPVSASTPAPAYSPAAGYADDTYSQAGYAPPRKVSAS